MRYLKYKNTNKNINNAWREYYLSLAKDQKRTFRKKEFWERLSSGFGIIVFILCIVLGIGLIKLIPSPSNWWWGILYGIGVVVLGLLLLIISGFLTYSITLPLLKKAEKFNLPVMKKEIFSKACAYLRNFYKVQEPYILTKCYDSTDEKFKNKDVCIFFADGELRITVDLINGFLYGNRDIGCYAFNKDELVISKKQSEKLLIAELKTKEMEFLLGYRAKAFIEKNYQNLK